MVMKYGERALKSRGSKSKEFILMNETSETILKVVKC